MAAFACGLAIIIATGVKQSDASDKCKRILIEKRLYKFKKVHR